jgi:hypothetical protein
MKNWPAFFDRNIGNHLLQAARAAELCESCFEAGFSELHYQAETREKSKVN